MPTCWELVVRICPDGRIIGLNGTATATTRTATPHHIEFSSSTCASFLLQFTFCINRSTVNLAILRLFKLSDKATYSLDPLVICADHMQFTLSSLPRLVCSLNFMHFLKENISYICMLRTCTQSAHAFARTSVVLCVQN